MVCFSSGIIVNGPGNEVFPGSIFAQNQDISIGWGYLFYFCKDVFDFLTFPYNSGITGLLFDLSARFLLFSNHFRNRLDHFFVLPGFDDKI